MIAAARATTFLFVPGSRPDRFAKATAAGSDAVIIDLEDAVAPEDKPRARRQAARWLAGAPAIVRINGTNTPWFDEDVAEIATRPGLAGVMIPKADSADQLHRVRSALPGTALIPLVESALGLTHLTDIATAPGVARLAFGHLDFATDTGISPTEPDEPELLFACSQLVIASRTTGLPGPIAGITTSTRSHAAVTADARRQRRLGFTAKLLIHPDQVAAAHEAFAPTQAELGWALEVLNTRTDAGATQVNGEMVDPPVIARAQAIVRAART
ncbi:citrate lyase subunit beta/citryl-CoA lyase [Saccharopolyspora erythraea NRRL 2338]|uniref:Citrate lyase beta subunit n=2 Tax=Saccharopolyspora erythraea TaxID=1836 RepID=A4FC56_SACEN|nr:CoA ester lyase [Saccharopolyspora erythraea]EQD82345.1 citrate lyase [Saccharopolyspora erythraea D]PFG95397.1 citrate lyase subunit beta/citryl-CoA lyase [Saccharopolyspora erythraea NRRL 2338]QRK92037.1 CoA ester lyase [Saccharopolyspora erythraea]CAM01631.1 citrate lyase beta subunit [Saccharopolyspora erythraea NRRL 2338]